jgi:hypothetical protein
MSMDNRAFLECGLMRKQMNFRKQALSRASRLTYLSLSLSLVGQNVFDRGYWRHTLMSVAALILLAAIVTFFLDMRKGRAHCAPRR